MRPPWKRPTLALDLSGARWATLFDLMERARLAFGKSQTQQQAEERSRVLSKLMGRILKTPAPTREAVVWKLRIVESSYSSFGRVHPYIVEAWTQLCADLTNPHFAANPDAQPDDARAALDVRPMTPARAQVSLLILTAMQRPPPPEFPPDLIQIKPRAPNKRDPRFAAICRLARWRDQSSAHA